MLGLASWYLEERIPNLWKRLLQRIFHFDVWYCFYLSRFLAKELRNERRKATTELHGRQQ